MHSLTIKIIRLMLVTLLVVSSLSGLAEAQTGVSFSWYLIRDDNAFKSRNEYEELINTASLMMSRVYSMKSIAFQAFYGADLSAFNENTDQRNTAHQFGIFSRKLSGNFNTDFGIYAKIRRNAAQYIYYNTNLYSFYIKTSYEPDLNKVFTIGLNHIKNEFKEFSDLDNTTYRFYGKYQHFFQSRLSISGETGIGVKNYVNQSIFEYYGTARTMGNKPRYKEEPVEVMQMTADLNIGKSITDNTGINIGFGGSSYVGDPIESYSEGMYYYTENDLYDEPFSYENKYLSANLTRQFAVGFQGKIGLSFQDKN